jgi:hypothetical protein
MDERLSMGFANDNPYIASKQMQTVRVNSGVSLNMDYPKANSVMKSYPISSYNEVLS